MQVHLHFFSILRDCLPPGAERDQATVDLPEGIKLSGLVSRFGVDQLLGLAPGKTVIEAGWQVLVNGEFERDLERVLQEGDQVSILPPLAGG